jgi:hypothetical protein
MGDEGLEPPDFLRVKQANVDAISCRKPYAGNNLQKLPVGLPFSSQSKILRDFLTVCRRFGATALKLVKLSGLAAHTKSPEPVRDLLDVTSPAHRCPA